MSNAKCYFICRLIIPVYTNLCATILQQPHLSAVPFVNSFTLGHLLKSHAVTMSYPLNILHHKYRYVCGKLWKFRRRMVGDFLEKYEIFHAHNSKRQMDKICVLYNRLAAPEPGLDLRHFTMCPAVLGQPGHYAPSTRL